MSFNRTRVLRHPAVVDIGCGCGRPKLSSFFSSTSTSKILKHSSPSSSTTTSHRWETNLTSTTTTTTTNSSSHEEDNTSTSPTSVTDVLQVRRKKRNIVNESVAVVKESSEPYLDFRDSMLNMIVQKELYEWEDFRDLLHRLLELNCPQHHHIILRAFADVCNSLFATPPSTMIGGVDGNPMRPGASGS